MSDDLTEKFEKYLKGKGNYEKLIEELFKQAEEKMEQDEVVHTVYVDGEEEEEGAREEEELKSQEGDGKKVEAAEEEL